MTYATHLKTAAMNEIWKASGKGVQVRGYRVARFKRICKLMGYLERVR